MRQKKVKKLRKQLGLKLPVKADLRILKEVNKMAYFLQRDGTNKAIPTKRVVIVNAAKHQYRRIKKMMNNRSF
jgi:hypothetical protein